MPSVAVDPHDANHVVVAYMDYSLVTTGYAGIGIAVSQDGGTSWNYSSVPVPTDFDQGAANPIVKFDDQGHVFVSYMAVTFLGDEKPPITSPDGGDPRALGFRSNNGIFVNRSDDGGASWKSPVRVASNLYDGTNQVPFELVPDLAIDMQPTLANGQANPHYDSLYVTWARYYPAGQFPGMPDSFGGSDLFIAVSSDAGGTWTIQTKTNSQGGQITALEDSLNDGSPPLGYGFDNWARAAVGLDGAVYIGDFTQSYFGVDHSTDGAHTSMCLLLRPLRKGSRSASDRCN